MSEENKTFPKPEHSASWEYRSLYEHYCQLRTENAQLNSALQELVAENEQLKEKLAIAILKLNGLIESCGCGYRCYCESLRQTLEKLK